MAAPTTSGELAGYASAVVIVLASVGGGLKWLLGWREKTRRTREQGLQQWEDKLGAREQALNDAVEQRLRALEVDNTARAVECQALRLAFELVADALRNLDPGSKALARAEQILTMTFPVAPIAPAEMTASLETIERRSTRGTKQ
jgi:hypothetical protein